MPTERRAFLKMLSALGLSGLAGAARSAYPTLETPSAAADWCGSDHHPQPLFIPRDRGFLGRLRPDGEVVTLRAAPVRAGDDAAKAGFTLGYVARHRGRDYVNPTLVLQPAQRVRLELASTLDEPTIVHWHGLAVDARNDGSGMSLVARGGRYAYDFEVRNRSALYWYHPHPHGLTGGQAYRGLFGLIEIADDDERALRSALALVPGESEIPLILQDRRGAPYAAGESEQMHGFLGDTVLINGTACPYLDVATRIYRFRILNASNARTYRLGLRSVEGKPVPFTLIGSDGGLLASGQRCDEAFIAAAERIDVLVDMRDATLGDRLFLETRAFDPMHLEMAPNTAAAAAAHAEHAGHGSAFAEGAPRALLELRVRERLVYDRKIPPRLSTMQSVDVSKAEERPLRLGFAKGRWRINDKVFAMGETPIEVKRGTVETWLIRNYFNSMPHAMHLHGFRFQVLERQTSPDQVAALKVDARGRLATDLGWKDTALIWPGESVRIAIDFTLPFPGEQTYVFHCHNMEHEDGGMMLGVRVI